MPVSSDGSDVAGEIDPRGVLSGHQACPCRGAERTCRIGVRKKYAPGSEDIDIRCFVKSAFIAAKVHIPHIINQDKHYIGFISNNSICLGI